MADDDTPPLDTTTANREATGAPGTVTLAGQVYLIAQPTPANMVTIWKHLAASWKKRNADPIGAVAAKLKGLPSNVQEIAIREAVRLNAGNTEPDNAALTPLLLEAEGVAFAYWLLINKAGQKIELAKVQEAITEDNVDDYVAEFMHAVGLAAVSPK
jgi:hypothetical protein